MLTGLNYCHKQSGGFNVLLLFCYYAVIPGFIYFLLGAQAEASLQVDFAIKFTAIILSAVWLLLRFSPNRGRNFLNTRLTSLGLVYLLLVILTIYSAVIGFKNDNSAVIGDTIGLTVFLWLCAVSYFSIETTEALSNLVSELSRVLRIFAILRIIIVIGITSGIFTSSHMRWSYALLLLFGYSWYFSNYLISGNNDSLFSTIIFVISIIIGFEKPIIGSFLFCSISIILIVFFRKNKIFKKRLFDFSVLLLILFVITYGSGLAYDMPWAEKYITMFETNYLKEDPETGTRAGLDGGRIDLWNTAGDLVRNQPWLGYGLGKTIPSPYSASGLAVHNIIFYMLIATGFIGFITSIIALMICMRRFLKSLLIPENLVLKTSLLGFISSMFGFGLVGTLWATTGLMVIFGISFGSFLKLIDISGEKT